MNTHLVQLLWTRKYLLLGLGLLLLVALGLLPAAARPAEQVAPAPPAQDLVQAKDIAPDCSLLDRPDTISLLSFGLQTRLAVQCGRLGKLPTVLSTFGQGPVAPFAPLGVDVQENIIPNPRHQDESDLAINGSTICSNYNDSDTQPSTYMGFSVSTDGGATYTDRGSFSSSFGDPAMIYRAADGFFYAASIGTSGLSLYKSTDNCQTFAAPTTIHSGASDDKEMMQVDNNPSSAFYGRMYVCWTNFNIGGFPIQVTWSSNGGSTWSGGVTVSTGSNVQGCWPGVAPNGDVYVVYIQGYTTGTNNIQMARSTNGGVSWSATTNVATGIAEAGISQACGTSGTRPAMNGNIRTWAMPQVAVAPSGRIHVAFTRKDGSDRGNIYYSHSDDNGTTWSAPVRINDDSTTNDDWHSTIAVNANGTVVISWYDRREDTGNMLFRRYAALSLDNGNTWQPNVAVGDVLSPVPPLLPNFDPGIRDCYMGDYDAVAIDTTNAYIQWSDNRNLQSGFQQPDMFLDRIPLAAPTPTNTATTGPSPTPTNTPVPPTPTNTSVPPTPTNTPLPTNTPTVTPTPGAGRCANIPPDPFGYVCDDTVARAWITGTINTGLTGDDQVVALTLPFTFSFYGTNYTRVSVSTNGNLQFARGNTAYANVCLPSTSAPKAMIAPFWDDLYPPGGGAIYYVTTGVAPNRVFTVEWRNIVHYPSSPSGVTFEVQLDETLNDLYMVYQDVDFGDPTYNSGASATVGIQNAARTFALQYGCNQAVLTPNLAIRFYKP